MNRKSVSTRRMAFSAMFSALIAIGAFIQIPIPMMDYFTLQFLFVILAGLLLGSKWGAISVGVYLAIGLVGFPVFAAGGGIQYIFRPSFGYLIGFLVAAYVIGWVSERGETFNLQRNLCASFLGMLVTYLIGFGYKYLIMNFYVGQATPIGTIVLASLALDIPGDAVLCLVGSALAVRVKKAAMREVLG